MLIEHTRFSSASWYDEREDKLAVIGGAGGIGSWLGIMLARIGVEPLIFDFDRVEAHNLGGQFFRKKDLSELKVTAVADIIKEFTGVAAHPSSYRIRSNDDHSIKVAIKDRNFVSFSAFDNMEARKYLFYNWLSAIRESSHEDENFIPPGLFVDGRLEAEQLQIFCVDPRREGDIEAYIETLFDDSEVPDAPCALKQTSHVAAMIASYMTSIYTNFLANKKDPDNGRSVPRYFEVFIPILLTNITE